MVLSMMTEYGLKRDFIVEMVFRLCLMISGLKLFFMEKYSGSWYLVNTPYEDNLNGILARVEKWIEGVE